MKRIFLLVDDLIFSSRIKELARARAIQCISIRSSDMLSEATSDDLILLDLGFKRFDWSMTLKATKPRASIMAFFPHTATEMLASAEELGILDIYPRSSFVIELPRVLDAWSRPQAGLGYLTSAVLLLILSSVGYCGYKILPWYYEYYELQNHFEQLTKIASLETDTELRTKLSSLMRHSGLPIGSKDVIIKRVGGRISLEAAWDRVFAIPISADEEKEIHTFHFEAYAESIER